MSFKNYSIFKSFFYALSFIYYIVGYEYYMVENEKNMSLNFLIIKTKEWKDKIKTYKIKVFVRVKIRYIITENE